MNERKSLIILPYWLYRYIDWDGIRLELGIVKNRNDCENLRLPVGTYSDIVNNMRVFGMIRNVGFIWYKAD